MARFATFWTGSIDALERACLASFSAQGHQVVLFSYEEREPSPLYEVRSASEIMDGRYLTRFITGGRPNVAHFADAFRAVMFTKQPLIWIDCDLLLRSPLTLDPTGDVFVREGTRNIINALLRIADPRIAERVVADTMNLEGLDLPWAATQNIIPRALAAEKYAGPIQDPARYVPVAADDFHLLLLPEHRDECASLCEGAETVHLYNNILQKVGYFKDLLPPEGSYLHELLAPYAEAAGFIGTYPANTVRAMVEGWQLRFSGKALGLGAVLRQLVPAARTTLRRRRWA